MFSFAPLSETLPSDSKGVTRAGKMPLMSMS
jgi:hypothetical protein